MRLDKQSNLTVVEPESDRLYLPEQLTEPTVSLTDQPDSAQPNPVAIASFPTLTDSEFSPERPGPAWMWEFGVMG